MGGRSVAPVKKRQGLSNKSVQIERGIAVVCPKCGQQRTICMQRLWLREKVKNHLYALRCKTCRLNPGLGTWHVPQRQWKDEPPMTVLSWLRHNCYDGQPFYDCRTRPPNATVELFYGMGIEDTHLRPSSDKFLLDEIAMMGCGSAGSTDVHVARCRGA